MKVVYVAGPFRADNAWEAEQNVRRAEELALEVWKLGAACICPHTNTRFFQGVLPAEVFYKGDLEILKMCDAILMTPGWEASKGATLEYERARQWDIPQFVSIAQLELWLKGGNE